MNRLILLMIIGGVCLVGWGVDEFRKAPDGRSEPVKVELTELEKTGKAPATYLEVGAHRSHLEQSLYYGDAKKDRIDWALYPIVATTADDKPKDDKQKNAALHFVVMVKTTAYATQSAIPREIAAAQSVSGRVLSIATNFPASIADLVRSSYPGIDPDRLIIIDDGVSPSSARMQQMGKMA